MRNLLTLALTRGIALIVSGLPTMASWALLSTEASIEVFAGVALAVGLPALALALSRSLGSQVVWAAGRGPEEFRASVAATRRAQFVLAAFVAAVGVAGAGTGTWSRLLGRQGFDMDVACFFTTALTAVIITTMSGERVLVALHRSRSLAGASALSGPATLGALCVLLFALDSPSWTLCGPFLAGPLVTQFIILWLAQRAIAKDCPLLGSQHDPAFVRTSSRGFVATEMALQTLPWATRPILQLVAGPGAVAAFALGYQFAQPAVVIVSSLAQSLWPHYREMPSGDRISRARRDALALAGFGLIAGACSCAALILLPRLGWLAPVTTVSLAIGWLVLTVVTASVQPFKLLLSRGDHDGALLALGCFAVPLGLVILTTLSARFGATGGVLGLALATSLMGLSMVLIQWSGQARRAS